MLSLNATKLGLVASAYKKVSWLFTVVDTAGPTTYYWSTITRSYGGHDYVFKIDPKTFNGVTLSRGKSELGIQAPNDLTFTIENTSNTLTASNFVDSSVTLDLVLSDGTDEETIATWKFNTKRCEAIYQTLKFTCEDFLQQYLSGDYPNTRLVKDISPSSDIDKDDDLCVPVPIGTCYIPLRSIYVTNDRFYLLGLDSHDYTISKVRSPRSWGTGKSEWATGDYAFNKSTKTIDTVVWEVFQAIISDSDGDGVVDANGVWQDGDYLLDMPTEFYRDDTHTLTSPDDAIEFILEDLGVASGDIDTGGGSSFETAGTTFSGWSLVFNGAYYKKQDSGKVIASLLNMCHSIFRVTDKIELHVLSKTSQKTITKADVILNSFKFSTITKNQNDSGYVLWQESGEAQDEYIKSLVSAKASTDEISSDSLEIPFVQDSQDVQRIGTLYYQRKFLKEANCSFSNKGGTLLAVQPDDVITINEADYGGNYAVLVDSMTIKRDLTIDVKCVKFSEALDDWDDLTPAAISPATNDVPALNTTGSRLFSSQPVTPYNVGDLWSGGPSGDLKKCKTERLTGAYVAADWELTSDYNKTAKNLQFNGDFELDASSETDPTYWTRTIKNGTPLFAMVWIPTPESLWPPWKPEGHCFYANCNDAAQYIGLKSDYFIPVSQDSYYCLSAWVKTFNGRCYLGIAWYDKDYVKLSHVYVCMNGYEATHAWEQKSSAAFKPSDYNATARYVKIWGYPQYKKIGYTMISRIQLVESRTPIVWEDSYAVAPGADVTADSPQPADWLSDLIGTLHIADDAITAAKIAVAGLDGTTGNVAANHIVAAMIQAGVITATELNVATLSAISANLGTITAGTVTGALIRTSTGNDRVEMDATNNRLNIYKGGSLVGYLGYSGSGAILYINHPSAASYLPVRITDARVDSNTFTCANTSITDGASNYPMAVFNANDDAKSAVYVHADTSSVYVSSGALFVSQDGTGAALVVSTGGVTATCTNAGQWASASSKELKENFEDFVALDLISNLDVKKYNYKGSRRKTYDEVRQHNLRRWKSIKHEKSDAFSDISIEDKNEKIDVVILEFTELQKAEKQVPSQYENELNRPIAKHISPMAEDFYDAFGVGDNKTIVAKDLGGIAFQAIKELSVKITELEARIVELEK